MIIQWSQRHQIGLYLVAIALGVAIGLLTPQSGGALEILISPVLGLLLFATFLSIPLVTVGRGLRDIRFLGTVTAANFVVVPMVAWGLSRVVTDDRGLLLGVLLVLLTPCIDYVIVFTGLAGGDKAKLLAATPVLLLLQMALLPVYLYLFAGPEALGIIEVEPFASAFVTLIVLPLGAAVLVQWLARSRRTGVVIQHVMDAAMVPLLMATLLAVIGSQIAAVGSRIAELLRVIPIYAIFIVVAMIIGAGLSRIVGLSLASRRAVVFATVTRNSLAVLPLALALPPSLALAPLAVVTQTMVELVAMVIMVRWVPRMIRD